MTRQELTDYIFDAYSVEPDFPFPRDDVTCVFRHADNRKWFGIAMVVPYRTVGMPSSPASTLPSLTLWLITRGGFRPLSAITLRSSLSPSVSSGTRQEA